MGKTVFDGGKVEEGGRARRKEDGPARAHASRQAEGCSRVSRGAPGPAKYDHKYFPQREGRLR